MPGERVSGLKSFPDSTSIFAKLWLGLDPEDNPLMLRNAGTQDVCSLDFKTAE
jgi:hypothetical protein